MNSMERSVELIKDEPAVAPVLCSLVLRNVSHSTCNSPHSPRRRRRWWNSSFQRPVPADNGRPCESRDTWACQFSWRNACQGRKFDPIYHAKIHFPSISQIYSIIRQPLFSLSTFCALAQLIRRFYTSFSSGEQLTPPVYVWIFFHKIFQIFSNFFTKFF